MPDDSSPETREAPGSPLEPLGVASGRVAYFSSAIAASAFAFAVVMSPALHAASASRMSAVALLAPAGFEEAVVRGAWLSLARGA